MTESQSKARIAPNSKESEMMVLGCMLTSINSLNIAADGLDDADFYYNEHKIGIFSSRARFFRRRDISEISFCRFS